MRYREIGVPMSSNTRRFVGVGSASLPKVTPVPVMAQAHSERR